MTIMELFLQTNTDALMEELNATNVPLQRYKDEGYITREANLTVFNNVGIGYYNPDTENMMLML